MNKAFTFTPATPPPKKKPVEDVVQPETPKPAPRKRASAKPKE